MRLGRGTLGLLACVEAEAEGGDSAGLAGLVRGPAALPSRLNSQSEALSSGRREDPCGADLWPHRVLPDSREPEGRDTAVAWAGLAGRRAQGRRQPLGTAPPRRARGLGGATAEGPEPCAGSARVRVLRRPAPAPWGPADPSRGR